MCSFGNFFENINQLIFQASFVTYLRQSSRSVGSSQNATTKILYISNFFSDRLRGWADKKSCARDQHDEQDGDHPGAECGHDQVPPHLRLLRGQCGAQRGRQLLRERHQPESAEPPGLPQRLSLQEHEGLERLELRLLRLRHHGQHAELGGG